MRQNCDEIPVSWTIYFSILVIDNGIPASWTYFINQILQGYDVAGVAPDFLEGPPPKPCQTCPAGPPGFNGTDVSDDRFWFFFDNVFDLFLI